MALFFNVSVVILLCIICIMQAISLTVRSNLEKADEFNLTVQANILKKQMEHVVNLGEQALNENPAILHTASRDVAISLAHIYIGEVLFCPGRSNERCTSGWCSSAVDNYSMTGRMPELLKQSVAQIVTILAYVPVN